MTDAKARFNRRWLYIPWTIAAFVFAAYFVLWRAGAAEMNKAFTAWVEDQREKGFEVSHGALQSDGFPFFLRLHVEAPSISAPGVARWRTERLTIDALPYDLNRLIFSVRSEQHFSITGYGDWRVNAEDFRVSIANDRKRDWAFATTVGEASAVRIQGGASASLDSFILDLAPDEADKTTLTVNLLATGVKGVADGNEVTLDKLQTAVAATQTHAFSSAEAWRNAGGALSINGFFAQREDARFAAAGTLRLDGKSRLQGDLKTELIAPAALIRLLGDVGAMSEDEAESAAASITLAAIAAGGKLTAPIELKDGAAHLAGVKIADLPSLE